jgi:beta-glucosidase
MNFSASEFDKLSLAQLVAQMVVVRTSGHLLDRQIQYPVWEAKAETLQHWVADLGVGGVIFLGGSVAEMGMRTQQIQSWAKYPLLMAADIEEGVGQRFPGASWFPPPLTLSAIYRQNLRQATTYAQAMGDVTAREALAIGLNWILGPIVDVNNNPANPVINVRAFGETAAEVSALATAFIAGVAAYPVLTCAKHFPGHGDTATDSHLDLPVIEHGVDRLRQVEIPPFQAAIAAGVDGVMTAHLLIPSLDDQYPATLSPKILTGELRQRLEFNGLIVTDALMMGAIVNRYGAAEAAVLAVQAGTDIVLMPVDPPAAITAICQAVQQGKISEEQIRASVGRIWVAKQKIFNVNDESPAPRVNNALSLGTVAEQGNALVDQIDRAALQSQGNLPLAVSGGGVNLIMIDEILDCPFLGRTAPAIVKLREQGYDCQIVNKYTPPNFTVGNEPVILQLFIRGNPFLGGLGIAPLAKKICQELVAKNQLQALVIYGSPYLFQELAAMLPADLPGIFSFGQMPSAQGTALDRLFGTEAAAELVSKTNKTFTD